MTQDPHEPQQPYRPRPFDEAQRGEQYRGVSIALYLVLTLLTLGLWNLYWNWRQMRACNRLLGRREFSWPLWLFLSLLTCGIYHLFYQYKMGAAINEIQHARGLALTDGLPVLSVIAAILGVGVVADCIHQHELNKIFTAEAAV